MPTKVAQIERFSGLDLRQDPGEYPGAVALQNIEFQPGRMRSRPGTETLFNPSSLPVYFLHTPPLEGTVLAVVGDAVNTAYVIDLTGAILGSTTFAAGLYSPSAVNIGTPTTKYTYLQVAGVVSRWDGAVWTTPGTFPVNAKRTLTISPTDNRLMVTSLQAGGNYRTHFSDPGLPETFGANNYVDLQPGDGEIIADAAVFNNQTFIFKRTKFFVFYGNSTDSVGNPVFNYRTVQGVGVAGSGSKMTAVHTSGVYFIGPDGIYRTTGGPARRISDPLTPFFTGRNLPRYWTGSVWERGRSPQTLHWHQDVLYVAVGTRDAGQVMFTYDPALDVWSQWDGLFAQAFATTTADNSESLLLTGTTTKLVYRNSAAHTDSGEDINTHYQSGYLDLGSSSKKTIRETILDGTGVVNVSWATDYTPQLAADRVPVTLGTAPATASGRHMRAVQGQRFSYYLQDGGETGFEVNGMQVNVIAERPAHVT